MGGDQRHASDEIPEQPPSGLPAGSQENGRAPLGRKKDFSPEVTSSLFAFAHLGIERIVAVQDFAVSGADGMLVRIEIQRS
ncbi:MAG TPA: hypothetical protein VGK99_15400 [Acidobacteriota bacterium]|jgi:hypothetical protein